VATTRFAAIPNIPQADLTAWESIMLKALKENVELLIGSRGEVDNASRAITFGYIEVARPAALVLINITARGTGPTLGTGEVVASLEDHIRLINDVSTLAGDVVRLRATVDALIDDLTL